VKNRNNASCSVVLACVSACNMVRRCEKTPGPDSAVCSNFEQPPASCHGMAAQEEIGVPVLCDAGECTIYI